MAIINTVTASDFTAQFHRMGRGDNFTHSGLLALYDYLDELSDDTGTPVELDVIGLCCEFSEYEDLAEFHKDYDADEYPDLDTLRDYTTVIEIDGSDSFIIGQF